LPISVFPTDQRHGGPCLFPELKSSCPFLSCRERTPIFFFRCSLFSCLVPRCGISTAFHHFSLRPSETSKAPVQFLACRPALVHFTPPPARPTMTSLLSDSPLSSKRHLDSVASLSFRGIASLYCRQSGLPTLPLYASPVTGLPTKSSLVSFI